MEEIHHGGNLLAAKKQFGIKTEDWLDLSTGINPSPWPIPKIPIEIWNRLPDGSDDLIEMAKNYYACNSLLPIPGSQFAIQTLPKLFPQGTTVAIPDIGYQEHRAAWEKEEQQLYYYSDNKLDELDNKIESGELKVVIVINPNNPSCTVLSKARLNRWLTALEKRHGYLIIDEAFMDTTPKHSMVDSLNSNHLMILKSFGKFFGLAGLRLGFVLTNRDICQQLNRHLGPWGVNHPARWIAAKALADKMWQQETREKLVIDSQRLKQYLENHSPFKEGHNNIKKTSLFVTLGLNKERARKLYQELGQQGILVRHIPTGQRQEYIRFGLIRDECLWKKFDQAIKTIK